MYRCRMFVILALCFAFALPLFAAGEAQGDGRNPNDPLDQGGETCATATPILTLPYCDTGTTVGFINDYPVPCQTASTAPDVVYSMTPPVTSVLSFSLCGSSYNTALTIWRGCPSSGGVLVCCSDNVCGDDACCSGVTLNANVQYFIVVDGGVAPDRGTYLFNVVSGNSCPNEPCQQQCPYPNVDFEPNNTCTTPNATVTCGDTLCGFVEPGGNDYYIFVVPGPGQQRLTIDVFGNDTPGFFPFGQGLNPTVDVLSCAAIFAADDNSGVGNDARIDSFCINPGTYLLRVSSPSQNFSGPYILAIHCEPCASDSCPFPSRDAEPINNNCGGNTPNVTCGDTLCGVISTTADRDWYRLNFTQFPCADIHIAVYGNDTPGHFPFGQGLNPKVSIWTADCVTMLAQDDDGGVGLDALLDSLCLPAGSYNVLVESSSGLGPYELWIWCTPCECFCPYPNQDLEPNGLCSGGGAVIACGDTTCGEINPIGDNDYYYFRVLGTECQLVTIDVFGNDTPGWFPFGQGLDPLVALVSAACDTSFGFDDNSGFGNDARLDSICLEPGTYRLLVRSASPQTSGPYILATSCSPCACQDTCPYPDFDVEPLNNTCGTNNEVLHCQDNVCGEIVGAAAPDQDWYVLQIPSCTQFVIDILGDDTGGYYPFGLGLNTAAEIWSADCSTMIAQDFNSGNGEDARITTGCLEAGIYMLRVYGELGTQGPYIVLVACALCQCPDSCSYPNRDNEPVNNSCGTFNPPTICGDTLCGELSANDLVDWYLITVVGPGSIRLNIDVFGNDTPGWYPFGLGLDPVVFLYGAGCTTLLGTDDNGGAGEDSHLSICLTQGSYNIAVSYQGGLFGPYILATACEPCDTCPYPSQDIEPLNDNCGTFNPIIHCNDALCGEITQDHGINDDWYVLQLTQCTQLFIDVLGNDTPGFYPFGQGLNTAVELWRADCQQVLYQDQNSGFGEDANLTTPCLEPGIYMLRVYGENATEGPYIIFVGCESCTCPTPCDVICPPQAIIENEPCPSNIDTVNGGCDNALYRFSRIQCGDVYCATTSFSPDYIDADWYRFGLSQDRQVRICVSSEFEGYLDIRNEGPSPQDCDSPDIIECLYVPGCTGLNCLSVCLPPGVYNVLFVPIELIPCRDYVLTMDCGDCEATQCEAPDSVVIHYPDTIGVGNELEDMVLYWPAVPAADEYRIYRTSDNNGPFIPTPATYVATTTDLFYVHEDVVANDGINEIWIYYVLSYCYYDDQPCLPFSTATLPRNQGINIPRE